MAALMSSAPSVTPPIGVTSLDGAGGLSHPSPTLGWQRGPYRARLANMEDFPAQEMVHPTLREFAASDDLQEVCSVIVELAAPPPQLPTHPTRPPQYAPRAGQ